MATPFARFVPGPGTHVSTSSRVWRCAALGVLPAHLDLTAATLAAEGERFAWNWRPDEQRLDQLLWPVARSAVELLTAGDPRRIKVCENPYGCGWLFYDGSKNGSRRWCSMEGCGSQVKMRRQYAKRRASAGGDSR